MSASDDAGDLADGELRVSSGTKFEENGARIGTGTVPLPGTEL